jgi:hypothetical protein
MAVRDHHGKLIPARAGKVEGIHVVFGGEFHAMEHAVDTDVDIGAIREVFGLILSFLP